MHVIREGIKRTRFVRVWNLAPGEGFDPPARQSTQAPSMPVCGGIRSFRLHGSGANRYKYQAGDLNRLKGLAEESGKQYCFMFNNVSLFDDAPGLKGLFAP